MVAKKQQMSIREMMYIVVFSAIAIVVGIFEVPLGFIGDKLDLSDVVILIAFLTLGFKNTSFVIILRSVVRFILPPLTPSLTAVDPIWKIIGEIIAMNASLLLILSLSIVQRITRTRQKPLIYATPVEAKKVSVLQFILLPIFSVIILTAGMVTFHIIFTMPLSLSGYSHITIFSFLKDPIYNEHSLKTIVITIVTMFSVINVVKGILVSIVYLILKPIVEKMNFN